MRAGFFSENWNDVKGNPMGGVATGRGFTISWQNGPLGRNEDRRKPNGAFVEDILDAVVNRLEAYQNSPFACDENAGAITSLSVALAFLDDRTKSREEREVEGTHEV